MRLELETALLTLSVEGIYSSYNVMSLRETQFKSSKLFSDYKYMLKRGHFLTFF